MCIYLEKKRIPVRPMIKFLKEKYGDKRLTGCEVGVFRGENALNMLIELNMSNLYLVDPWKRHKIHTGRVYGAMKMHEHYCDCKGLLFRYEDNITYIKKKSKDACRIFEDVSLDFCYIDGIHTSRQVFKDLKCWYPKVKVGGVLGGHDYDAKNNFDLFYAVNVWADRYDYTVNVGDRDWWIIKK